MSNEAFAATLPIQGTEVAAKWDILYYFLLGISVFFFVVVIGAMIYFAWKYRKQEGRKTEYVTGSHLLEAIWVVIPTILLMVIFVWGYMVYRDQRQAPSDAYEIKVVGKQWLWTFMYDNGVTTVGKLYVPINRSVKLVMTSEDVLHDFFIPNFRVKQDVVPGMYTSVWFEATVPGRHQVFCSQYCGTSHSGMLAEVYALNDDQWKNWLKGKEIVGIPLAGAEQTPEEAAQAKAGVSGKVKQVSLSDRGKELFETRSCNTCHTITGEKKIGPSFKGLYGSTVELSDGKTVLADDNYIHESIVEPQAKIVKGFGPVMPTFRGVLNEQEINAVIAYIKTVK